MTRSDHRSGPSRAIVFALLAAGLTLLVAPQASAKKKAPAAAAPAGTDDETPKTGDAAADEKPAAQANDEEKPKAALNLEQEAPKTDSLGHVHFASPNGEGLGRVVVNAPAAAKIKIFLEGTAVRDRAGNGLQRSQGRLHRRGGLPGRQVGGQLPGHCL